MENYKNLFDLAVNNSIVDPTTLATGGHDPVTEFSSAKAAFIFTGSFGYADVKSTVKNSSCIPYYCGVKGEEKAGLNCGTENCWAVNDNASDEDKQATMDFMRHDGYGWWIKRIGGVSKLYDAIRIDHFRGFESYWAVPYGDTTAKRGRWVSGPGMYQDVLTGNSSVCFEDYPVMRIQAEFVDGFGALAEIGPAVAVFGSARTTCSDPMYAVAKNVGHRLAKEDVTVITGGGPGIMICR